MAGPSLAGGIQVEPGTTVRVGQEVMFDGTGVAPAGAALLANGMVQGYYEWDFGDTYTAKRYYPYYWIQQGGTSLSHFFMRPGTYAVTLTVTDTAGLTTSESVNVTVTGDYPKLPPLPAAPETLWFRCENDLNDSSGNGLHGTIPAGSLTYGPGSENLSAHLPAETYIETPDHAQLDGMAQLTVSLWARKSANTTTGYLVQKTGCYTIRLPARNAVEATITTSAGAKAVTNYAVERISNVMWHHYVLTYDGAVLTLYVDGIATASGAATGTIADSTNPLRFGTSSFAGQLDEIKVFRAALTADDVTRKFELWHAPYEAHTRQYVHVQVPGRYQATGRLKMVIAGAGTTQTLLDKTGLNAQESVLLLNDSYAASTYTITAQLLDASGAVLDTLTEEWVKRHDGTPACGIDENNSLRVNGELFFPVTPFGLDNSRMANWKSQNCINTLYNQGWYSSYTTATWQDYIAHAQMYGWRVLGPGVWIGVPHPYRRNASFERLMADVAATKDSPSLLAWHLGDEPDIGEEARHIPAAVLGSRTYKCHELDPQHPVVTNFGGRGWIGANDTRANEYHYANNAEYFGGKGAFPADILGMDYYPIDWNASNQGNAKVWHVAAILDKMNAGCRGLAPYMSFVETADIKEGLDTPPATGAQARMLAWLSVAHGCKGVNWFHYFTETNADAFSGMAQFYAEITTFKDIVLGPPAVRTVTDDASDPGNRVDILVRESNDQLYIFAVRVAEIPETTTITTSFSIAGAGDATATVYGENRTRDVKQGSFSDSFAQNDVHIYMIPLSGAALASYSLSIAAQNGTVTKTPDKPLYSAGESVMLQATPLAGYQFSSWSGGLSGSDNPASLVMDSNKSVVANFTAVGSINHAPVLNPISSASVNEGQPLSFSISGTDPDGDPLTYGATGLPSGASLTGQTFTWTPTYTQAGTYSVTFTVSDGQVQTSQAVTITVAGVEQPPVLTAIGDKTVDENSTLTFDISATDPDGGTLTYSATGLPAGANFTGQTFTWTPGSGQAGSYEVTFVASDGSLTDSETITLVVASVAPDTTAPVAAQFSPAPDAIQVPLNNLITLHITDAGTGVDANSVIISINGNIIYQGNQAAFASPYGQCSRSGSRNDYRFIFQGAEMFDFDRVVTVNVHAADRAGNAMNEYAYSFITEMRSFSSNKQVSKEAGTSNKKAPVTACDAAGNIWAAWHAGAENARDIYVARLAAGAEAFDNPTRLTTDPRDQCNPDLAVAADGTVYVVWQDSRSGNWDIYASIGSGDKFSREVQVTNSDKNETDPAVAVDSQSPASVWVAWQDSRNGSQDVYVAGSSNAFASSTVAQVTTDAANQMRPDIAVDGQNTVCIVWTDMRNGQADIYGAVSGDGSWTNVPIVTGSADQTDPALAAQPGSAVLHLVWVDYTSGDRDIYYARLDGLSAGPVTGSSIVDDTSGADQTAPTIACDASGAAFACWQDSRHVGPNGTDSDLYFTEVSTGTVKTNILVGDAGTNANQSEPALALDAWGQPYVVWSDDRNTAPEIYFAATTFIDPHPLDSQTVAPSAGATIGTPPTEIDAPDDVSIVVPPHACQARVRVTISRIIHPQVSPVACLGSYDFGPSGIDFDQPVTVTIPYRVSGSGRAKAYWYDSLTGALSQQGITNIENIVIASNLNALRFQTTHFTPFYVVASDVDTGLGGTLVSGGGCALSPTRDGSPSQLLIPYAIIAAVMVALRRRDRRRLLQDNKLAKCHVRHH